VRGDLNMLVNELATGLWRLHGKVAGGTGQLRPIRRDVQAMLDTLTESGIEVQSHNGLPFDGGLAMHVIAFQPTAGIEREIVAETVRPSVYVDGRLAQFAQVVVATPKEDTDAADH
jgi:hypothetical protein